MTHETKTPFGRRFCDLREDTVFVRGDIPLRGNFETTLTLADLDPNYERIWIRSHCLRVGVWFFGPALIAYLAETKIAGMDGWGTAGLFTLMWAFGGTVLMLVGLKKYQIARFKTKSGVPALEVFEAGPTKSAFPSFVAELVSRISSGKKIPDTARG